MGKSIYRTEVCVDDYNTAIKAALAGADRLELCVSLIEGGLTPPFSLMQKVCKDVNIDVHVMIRPRSGDFLYSEVDFDLMKNDIDHARKAGAKGIVFGILNADGTIDVKRSKELVMLAQPLNTTFHRAFDLTPDPFLALEEIITIGVDTILTSGQAQTAEDGLEVIRELTKRAENRIEIMAGSGINSTNVQLLLEAGTTTFHFTCKKIRTSTNQYISTGVKSLSSNSNQNLYEVYDFDDEKFQGIISILKNANGK